MCYKYLWDNTVAHNFPSDDFYRYFGLDPQSTLSEDVRDYSARLGIHAKVLSSTFKVLIMRRLESAHLPASCFTSSTLADIGRCCHLFKR